ncbi:hypothetical protein [Nitrosospira sp. Nsp13]|uniref:hypothetical protein n=1 Tax=Nitrosospira sp. Nsp13 TaxID=1855332 RepID=UPI000B86F68E|nr:hypothetical protein [Nitrosospira sp. Nsp13]
MRINRRGHLAGVDYFEISSAKLSHPHGNFVTGVFGTWHYDEALGAFVALDEISNEGGGV